MPAAGAGRRFGGDTPKQYLPLAGRAVMVHALERVLAHPQVKGVLVGLAADDAHFTSLQFRHPRLLGTYVGGTERADTVLKGLTALSPHAQPNDWVLVHDAVRPCLHQDDLTRLLNAMRDSPDGALLATPLADTLKEADAAGRAARTMPREKLWRALTPQLFPLKTLRDALARALSAGVPITDEASAVETAGGHPRLVAGRADNIKITLPTDLLLAERILAAG